MFSVKAFSSKKPSNSLEKREEEQELCQDIENDVDGDTHWPSPRQSPRRTSWTRSHIWFYVAMISAVFNVLQQTQQHPNPVASYKHGFDTDFGEGPYLPQHLRLSTIKTGLLRLLIS